MDVIRRVHSKEEFYISEILTSIQSPPPELEGTEEFARLLASVRTALGAAVQDQDNGQMDPKLVLRICEELDEAADHALKTEEAKDRQSET
eukprot:9008008-Pyramimonas_sp.AAC.1